MVASGPKLLPKAMPGSMVLLQLGSLVLFKAGVSMGIIGTMLCWASPAHHWPWDSWSCSLLEIAAEDLALPFMGELKLKKDDPTPHHRCVPHQGRKHTRADHVVEDIG